MLKDCPSIHCLPTSVLGPSLGGRQAHTVGSRRVWLCLGGPRHLNVTPDYLVDLKSHLLRLQVA